MNVSKWFCKIQNIYYIIYIVYNKHTIYISQFNFLWKIDDARTPHSARKRYRAPLFVLRHVFQPSVHIFSPFVRTCGLRRPLFFVFVAVRWPIGVYLFNSLSWLLPRSFPSFPRCPRTRPHYLSSALKRRPRWPPGTQSPSVSLRRLFSRPGVCT